MPVKPNRLLDLADRSIGQRRSMIRYYVATNYREVIGTVKPLSTPTLTLNTTGNYKRTMSGLRLRTSDLEAIDPLNDRLRPTFVLEDGTEWPMGEFLFAEAVSTDAGYTPTSEVAIADGEVVLDQPFRNTFAVAPGGNIGSALNAIADQALIMWRDIADTGAKVLDPIIWPAGTPRKRAMTELCSLGGFLPPYFDNEGTLIVRAVPDMSGYVPDIRYSDRDRRIAENSLKSTTNYLAPNVHLVVNNGPVLGVIAGEARVDPSLPIAARNMDVVEVHREQGIESTEQANAVANRYAETSPLSYGGVQFATVPDPRHDLYMVVGMGGANWREVSCSMPLSPSGPQQHTLAKGGFGG